MPAATMASVCRVRAELRAAVEDTRRRGLLYAAKWAAEQLQGLPAAESEAPQPPPQESDLLLLARSYFDLKEYRRAAHVIDSSTAPDAHSAVALFVRMYALYLAGEKLREEQAAQSGGSAGGSGGGAGGGAVGGTAGHPPGPTMVRAVGAVSSNPELGELHEELLSLRAERRLDGYLLYLLGVVRRGLGMKPEAIEALSEAVPAAPCNWSAWQELASLCPDTDTLGRLSLPTGHWAATLFHAQLAAELQHQKLDEVIGCYQQLEEQLFPKSTYILVQKAMVYYLERQYHLRVIRIPSEILTRLRVAYVFGGWPAQLWRGVGTSWRRSCSRRC
jgi:anaphase-promoting complex subunit 8